MVKKQIIFSVLSILFISLSAYTASQKIILGGKDGWETLSYMDSVAFDKGRFGYDSIRLSTNYAKQTPSTDMLISFDNGAIYDETGNYEIALSNMEISANAIMGDGTGMTRLSNQGLILKGKEGSLFGSQGLTGSFTIEFWLYPAIAENGEQIFNWRSSRNMDRQSMYQVIRACFFNNHIEWNFHNIFSNGRILKDEVILTSLSTIIPQQWSHHSLSYDDETGLLEYRINGRIEALQYMTVSNTESNQVLNAYLGVPADIQLCPHYSGLIDDFTISRDSQNTTSITMYNSRGGRFETQPLETNGFNSSLKYLDATTIIPPETGMAFFVRGGDNFYEWTDTYPEWEPVSLQEEIKGVTGKYMQIAVELYPDGNGQKTPSVSELVLSYEATEPPLPPAVVEATSGNSYIDLSWSPSVDYTVGGYTIYYGEHPGEYLGRVAVEGVSPIQAGNVLSYRLTGLQNGKIYYFAISAYSSLDERITGELSKEVYARPLRKAK